jgi:TetR/AcrR family transcriptional regulator
MTRTHFPLQGEARSPAPVMGRRAIRTRTLIEDTGRELFLRKGFGGTRIDDIAAAAGISRASFYTYFPSKRDLLLAIGTHSYFASSKAIEALAEVSRDWSGDDIAAWVTQYIDFLEEHGAFITVWSQATSGDEELRTHGMRAEMRAAKHLGGHLERIRGTDHIDPMREGLGVLAMIHHYWYFWRVVGVPMSRDEVIDTMASLLSALIRGGAAT